jgi:CheY-like chemotaxis protein
MTNLLKILYVDDETDIRTIAELSLRMDPSMEVVVVGSGDEALERIGTNGWHPDIALIDMMMPAMSGMELLAALHARPDTADLPVLFVTASARSMELKRYTDAGAIGVISKPFDAVRLARLVREHYDDWAKSEG